MKKTVLFLMAMVLMAIIPAQAQEDLVAENDSTSNIKKGWNFGGLPVVSYDSDLGLQYGALASIYHYGDGSRYPEFDHNFYVEASWFTKGSGIFRFAYESDRLIKNVRVFFDVSYIPDAAYDFIGFNGYESVYNLPWVETDNANYRTTAFYKMDRKMFRTRADFQGKLAVKNLYWSSGFEFYNVNIASADIDKYNKGKDEEDQLPSIDDMPGLYERYQDWGLIAKEDASGGNVFGVKAGLMYDSRDVRAHPTKGIWTDIGVFYAPSFLLNDYDKSYVKIYATHRQYLSIVKKRLTFAYRLGYQSSIGQKGPWYTDQFLIMTPLRGATSEGLGGGKTLRGIKRNRVVGDGIVYGNLELRWKAIFFKFIGQNFYIGLNGFMDAGQAVKLMPIEDQVNSIVEPGFVEEDYFDIGAEKMHIGYGAGLRIAMNENFIIALDHGRALNEKDGSSGTYIGLNYLF
jgi:outer membrane protein assembly factor BamA